MADRRAGRPALGLVVPLFDEAERLADYGKELIGYAEGLPAGSELVFVDDGSRDDTAAVVEALIERAPHARARLLRRPHVGKGAAIAAGLASVTAPYAGFCDVDLATPLDQLDLIVLAAAKAPVLAVGSRDLAGSVLLQGETRVRESLGRAYNRLIQVTVAPGVIDTQCGAKVAARSIWDAVLPFCRETGFAWDAEVVGVAMALGIEVEEIPVVWRHDERSRVRVGRDGVRMVLATRRLMDSVRRARQSRPAPVQAVAPTEVFDSANAAALAGADRTHWWFRSKAAYVATAIRRTAAGAADPGWLVDVGAGAGGVTAMLGWRSDRVVVVEGNAALTAQAREAHGLAAVQGAVGRVPLVAGRADVVCLLDVIEHVSDPVGALREAARLLAPDGRVVVNVPAHPWLWSAADEELGHLRRYTRRLLATELRQAGLEPVLVSHVFGWLVPPVWMRRRVSGRGQAELGLDVQSAPIDRAAMVLTAVERIAVGRVSSPVGTSVLAVATRR